jgi:hypothetical protein
MFSTYSLDDLLDDSFKLSLAVDNQFIQECKLIESSPDTKNPELNVLINDMACKMVVFTADKRRLSNNQEDNILGYFNNGISDLTKIPDYIVFIEECNIVDAIIIEMKSETYEKSDVTAKFKNGKIIAHYLASITDRILNPPKLLLSLPPTKKSPVNKESQEKFRPDTSNGWYTIKSKRFNALDLLALQP